LYISPEYAAVCGSLKSNADRSGSFEPFAPAHTVQAAFTAHGVPWEEVFITNAVVHKVRNVLV
jgi:hypothetical protein